MKYFLLFFLLVFLNSANCQPREKTLRCFEATSIFPFFETFEKRIEVSKYDTGTIKVYILGTKRMYDLLYHYTHTENGILKISEVRRHYLAFDIDSTFGYDLNMTSGKLTRVNLDSVFNTVWLTKNKLYPVHPENFEILTESKQNKDSGILVERYLIKNKIDSAEMGTCIFSYTNKISGIDVSLSKELDSIKQMKLYKAEIVSFPRYFKDKNISLGRFETCYLLKEGEILDEKKILTYFKMLHAY